MSEALQTFNGTVSVGGRNISNLRFADDIDLMAGSQKELGELTERVDTTSAAYGMEVSTEKSKIMAIATEKAQPEIKVRGKTLEQVESFKYLGTQITKDRRSDTEIISRLAMATSALAKSQPLLNNKSISLRTNKTSKSHRHIIIVMYVIHSSVRNCSVIPAVTLVTMSNYNKVKEDELMFCLLCNKYFIIITNPFCTIQWCIMLKTIVALSYRTINK